LSRTVAELVVLTFEVYAVLGLLFALLFVWLGIGRIDAAAKSGSLGFRLLVVPGAAALWPWLAWRWWRGTPPPSERNAHREAAR